MSFPETLGTSERCLVFQRRLVLQRDAGYSRDVGYCREILGIPEMLDSSRKTLNIPVTLSTPERR